jgi:hypothetical protein
MQITLTVEEGGSVNPSATFTQSLPGAFSLGANGTVSSTATRVDTSYSYYNVGKISRQSPNSSCHTRKTHGSSPLLKSELGIETYLAGAAKAARAIPSSAAPKTGEAKIDIYSYEIKFVIVSSGGVNPSWKLVNLSTNTDGPALFGASRSRTHDLTLTFGPGGDKPSEASLQTHFTQQVIQSNQRARQR